MSQKLVGKSAVVTGGGNGIGRGVALFLAAEGAQVVIADIGLETDGTKSADKVVAEIRKANGLAIANYDNVATKQGGENIINTAVSNFGKIDILVNCAGNFIHANSVDIVEEQWDSIINVHLKGHFCCVKAAIPEMIKQKSGRIINFSSRAASGKGGNLAYSTAKAGILGFTSALSFDLKEYGITVNAIIPSAETKLFPGKRSKASYENMPYPMTIEPEYVAPIIAFLSTDAAKDITGQYIYACGGDLCFYAHLLKMPGEANIFVRKPGKWTIDELNEVILPMLVG
jgi:NAD(P)-dependent dehydrogenase (short-subunit alcohol dehydrogenase family)